MRMNRIGKATVTEAELLPIDQIIDRTGGHRGKGPNGTKSQ